jgi:hypothetical protein
VDESAAQGRPSYGWPGDSQKAPRLEGEGRGVSEDVHRKLMQIWREDVDEHGWGERKKWHVE